VTSEVWESEGRVLFSVESEDQKADRLRSLKRQLE
jgi:hypothetical protein